MASVTIWECDYQRYRYQTGKEMELVEVVMAMTLAI